MSDAETSPSSAVQPRPPADSIFAPVFDRYGLRLALVFGSCAPGGVCPYFRAGCCHHCDIGAGEGGRFDRQINRVRLAWFQGHYADVLDRVAHLLLYDSGSVLNPREIPRDLLIEILEWAGELPALVAVSIESREAYITAPTLLEIVPALRSQHSLRPILGLETADDRLRNQLLGKRMPRRAIVRAFDATAAAARSLEPGRIGIDVNVVVGGPGTAEDSAIADATDTARFAFDLARERSVPVDLNLHPYYPSVRGFGRFPAHPRCSLAVLARAVAAIHRAKEELAPDSAIFIGAQDEGHDTERKVRAEELECAADLFDRYNRSQDPEVLQIFLSG